MYESIEVEQVHTMRPINPVWEMKQTMKTFEELPTNLVYKAVTTSKCGLGKTQGQKGEYHGMYFDSYWEFAFYLYFCEIKGHSVVRNTQDSFEYIDESGKAARFFPDFKVDGAYHEIKGIYRPNDMLKRDATIGLVTFWGPQEMRPILKAVYAYDPKWKERYQTVLPHKIAYGKK